jgi:hypothetical protein
LPLVGVRGLLGVEDFLGFGEVRLGAVDLAASGVAALVVGPVVGSGARLVADDCGALVVVADGFGTAALGVGVAATGVAPVDAGSGDVDVLDSCRARSPRAASSSPATTPVVTAANKISTTVRMRRRKIIGRRC